MGTSKACLTQGNDTDNQKKPLTEPHSEETLHDKMSEMHVCKNILLEQIHSMKNLCKTKEDAHVSVIVFKVTWTAISVAHSN